MTCFYPATQDGQRLRATNKDGYVRAPVVNPSGADKNKAKEEGLPPPIQRGAYAHQLMWFHSTGFDPVQLEPLIIIKGVVYPAHVSHLCHNPRCCNPDHLVREPAWVNILRMSCQATTKKECHCLDALAPAIAATTSRCIHRTDLKNEKLVAFTNSKSPISRPRKKPKLDV